MLEETPSFAFIWLILFMYRNETVVSQLRYCINPIVVVIVRREAYSYDMNGWTGQKRNIIHWLNVYRLLFDCVSIYLAPSSAPLTAFLSIYLNLFTVCVCNVHKSHFENWHRYTFCWARVRSIDLRRYKLNETKKKKQIVCIDFNATRTTSMATSQCTIPYWFGDFEWHVCVSHTLRARARYSLFTYERSKIEKIEKRWNNNGRASSKT